MNNESALSAVTKPAKALGKLFVVSSVALLMACNASNGGSSQDQSSSEDSSSSVSSVSSISSSSSSSSSSTSSEPDDNGNPAVGAMSWTMYGCQGCHGDGEMYTGLDYDRLVNSITTRMPQNNPSACVDECARDIAAWLKSQED